MPITTVEKDPENLTMTVVADFTVPLQRLWDAYVDPRQIEKFWGPPGWPATFYRHDAFPGGRSTYSMTGELPPEEGSDLVGEVITSGGYWDWVDVKAPEGDVASFEVRDGFRGEDGEPNTDLPSLRMVFHFESTDAGSRVITTSYFDSADDLEQFLNMGMEEGMREAMGQMDAVLADLHSFAHGVGTTVDTLSDTQVRVSRIIRGTVDQVRRAHTEPELLKKWCLGPDGWVMTECVVATEVGETYHYAWAKEDGSEPFGFGGTLDVDEGNRMVTTERMFGEEGPAVVNDMTLTAVEAGTLLSLVMTFPDVEARDQILATGMTDGMEASYARLEEKALA